VLPVLVNHLLGPGKYLNVVHHFSTAAYWNIQGLMQKDLPGNTLRFYKLQKPIDGQRKNFDSYPNRTL
jgi:hypothetical protein